MCLGGTEPLFYTKNATMFSSRLDNKTKEKPVIERIAEAAYEAYGSQVPWSVLPDWRRESWRLIAAAMSDAWEKGEGLSAQQIYAVWSEYRYIASWRGLTKSQREVWERVAAIEPMPAEGIAA
jgi:hypothetical protein